MFCILNYYNIFLLIGDYLIKTNKLSFFNKKLLKFNKNGKIIIIIMIIDGIEVNIMNKKTYSITTYELELKERERAPKGQKLEDLDDCSYYMNNKNKFINDFIHYLNSKNYKKENNYFNLADSIVQDKDIKGKMINVLYGKNGRKFLTIDEFAEEKKYNEKTKYICYYTIYFFVIENHIIMVSIRESNYGCKTVFAYEMRNFLSQSNLIVLPKIVSNEVYISKILNNANVQTLTFTSLYEEDNGEIKKHEKEICSKTSLELKTKNHKSILDKILNLIKKYNGETKMLLMTELKANYDSHDSIIDEESLKITININGIKRVVNLLDFEKMLFDIDITEEIEYDEDGKPIQESINKIVFDYVKGLKFKEYE